jgi:hypothetical protein
MVELTIIAYSSVHTSAGLAILILLLMGGWISIMRRCLC